MGEKADSPEQINALSIGCRETGFLETGWLFAPITAQLCEIATNPANLCPILLWWRGWHSMPRETILNNEDADCKRFLSDLTIKPGEPDWTGPQGSLW